MSTTFEFRQNLKKYPKYNDLIKLGDIDLKIFLYLFFCILILLYNNKKSY